MDRFLIWVLLGGMSLGILAIGFSANPSATVAGDNPAVNILSARQIGNRAIVVAERAGPGVLLSEAFIRSNGKQFQMHQDSCQTDTGRCVFSAPATAGVSEVQVCAVADLLPDQDFCDRKKF